MLPANKEIHLTFDEAISILRELEFMLLSLHAMGSFYADKDDRQAYTEETTRFVDEERVTHRLAEIRKLLCSKFDSSLGDDDMDDIERELVDLKVWSPRGAQR